MKEKKNNYNVPDRVIDVYADMKSPENDPDGSWTGVPADKNEKPLQDADDL